MYTYRYFNGSSLHEGRIFINIDAEVKLVKKHTSEMSHDVPTVDDWRNHMEATHHSGDPVMGHKEILGNTDASCREVVEKWHEWLFRIPAAIHPNLVPPSSAYKPDSSGIENPVFVMGNRVLMTSFLPLVKKEDNIVTFRVYKDTSYILLPVITAEACVEEYPSIKGEPKLWEMIKNETDSVTDLSLTIDSEPRMGCYVERKKKLEISNVANDNLMGIKPENMRPNNTIGVVYNGYWALLNVSRLGSGDHLVEIEAKGKTYNVGVTVALNVLI